MEPIDVNFKWTADDLLTGRQWHFKHMCRPVFRWAVHVVIALIVAVSVFSIFRVGPTPIPIGFLIAGFYLYVIRPFEIRWFTRRQFAKRPDRDIDIRWTISSEGIRTVTTHGKGEFQWCALSEVILTPDGFLFYPDEEIFHFLPWRGFREGIDVQRLVELAKLHAPKFAKVAR